MPGTSASRLTASGLLLLVLVLSSCSSGSDAPRDENGVLPAVTLPSGQSAETIPAQESMADEPGNSPTPSVDRPAATDTANAAAPRPSGRTPGEKPPAATPVKPSVTPDNDGVEVSNAPPGGEASKQPVGSPSASSEFRTDHPTLGGMQLGATVEQVAALYGQPLDKYPLPGEEVSIEIWDYAGFSTGFNEFGEVVYIEVTSAEFATGIDGLRSGVDGDTAARTLGLSTEDRLQVLSLEVSGGWLKVDLDPDTRKVISLKLLSREV